jgi:ArsR family transcriptional regulator, lead/cadmium/zinc/bismuth-responsive transcriptional repressor
MSVSTPLEPAVTSPGADRCDVPHAAAAPPDLDGRLMSPRLVERLAETFRALGDPTRVRILDALSKAELCVCDLAARLSLSESAVSHQLRLLRSLRLVRSRRAGRMVFYTLDDDHITGLFAQGLEHVREAAPAGSGDDSEARA